MDCVHHGYSGDGYASQRRVCRMVPLFIRVVEDDRG